jgi:hypothetical protein
MKLSDVIERLQAIKQEHGDLDTFDRDTYEIRSIRIQQAKDGNYPEDLEMPEKFVVIGSSH